MSNELDLMAGADGMDIFDTLAAESPSESSGMADLPVDAVVLMRTSTKKDGTGKTAPRVEFFIEKQLKPGQSELRTFYQFRTGLIAIGGDDKCNAKEHKGKYLFFDAFIHPGEKENVSQTLSGKLTGFLNNIFAMGVQTKERKGKDKDAVKSAGMARWQATIAFLRKVAVEKGLSVKQYDNDRARFVSGLAVSAIEDSPRVILVKTGNIKQRNPGDGPAYQVGIKSIEDATPEMIAELKVELFEGETMPNESVSF
jgi:hypothetical protein